MKPALAILFTVGCLAQERVKPEAPAPPAVESPVPAAESPFSGSIEIGYRWRTSVGGNLDAYRSVVDLGSGPKMLNMDFSVTPAGTRLFDRMDVRAQNWGDDPYSTAYLSARKDRVYEFSADYRNMAYFNALPSFANPLLQSGVLLNERSFDIRRRYAAMQLDLRPASRIIPYLAYERSSGYGRGVTTFVAEANEYAVPNRIRDGNDTYRGGIRLEYRRFHATGEIGRTAFKDDQQVFESSVRNPGNRETLFLNQRLFLTNLQQSYGVRGSGVFTKVLFTSNALSWLDLYGQLLYSRPETDTNYQQFNTGNFVVANAGLFLTMQQFSLVSQARMPHTAGSLGAEIRPLSRTRVLVSWLTDRLENTGASTFNTILRSNYSQSDADVIVEPVRQVTLRGGYRYLWGDARNVVTPQAGLLNAETGLLRRHIGKGGATYRPIARVSISADIEAASSDRVYFRTSLNDYRRLRIRARYQALSTLTLTGDMAVLSNENPAVGIDYDFLYRNSTLGILWTPAAGKRIQLHGSYSRSTIRSDIIYIAPQFFERERSFYRDNAHTADGRVDVALPQYRGLAPKLSLGGAFFFSSGSRPTRHYQPLGNLSVPLSRSVAWISEWRYHGFGERFYAFEAFRTHLITTGLRLSR